MVPIVTEIAFQSFHNWMSKLFSNVYSYLEFS